MQYVTRNIYVHRHDAPQIVTKKYVNVECAINPELLSPPGSKFETFLIINITKPSHVYVQLRMKLYLQDFYTYIFDVQKARRTETETHTKHNKRQKTTFQ